MGLDIDTSGLRRAGELVHAAGEILDQQLDADVPPCGGDEVSKALMDNLNAWQRWLVEHIKAGAHQAFDAAAGIHGAATGFETQDAAAAAAYGGAGGHPTPVEPASAHTGLGAADAAPAGPPTTSPVPDISGRDGEKLALALLAGAGPAPAQAKAAQWEGVAAQAITAHAALTGARAQLLASGEAAMSGPLLTRLDRAIDWSQHVATHAGALANGYSTAAGAYTTTTTAVGHPAVWRATKTNLAEARADPFGAPRAQAYQTQLTGMQHTARVTMTGYTTTGTAAGTPPSTLSSPGLAPTPLTLRARRRPTPATYQVKPTNNRILEHPDPAMTPKNPDHRRLGKDRVFKTCSAPSWALWAR
ncbi:PPE family protein [Mycobacterium kansasii]|uniref:PPE family protein n=1 Tax=Mycobacterium kansasii TaxID=1768 RepID=A0A1V3WEF5_MYCKA|nr:PPE family protein [Mycobacterium kansasii]